MKYFTFQYQFHQEILNGHKRSTIRPRAKLNSDECFALRYWTGKPYRSPMGILGTAKCIHVGEFIFGPGGMGIDNVLLHNEEQLADQEGFRSANDMKCWFLAHHGESFRGFIHIWSDFVPSASDNRDAKPCLACGRIVEQAREIYVEPFCFECLPPPEPLKLHLPNATDARTPSGVPDHHLVGQITINQEKS